MLNQVPYLGIGLTVSLYASALGPSTCATTIGIIALVLNGVRFPVASLVTFARKSDDCDAPNRVPSRRSLRTPDLQI